MPTRLWRMVHDMTMGLDGPIFGQSIPIGGGLGPKLSKVGTIGVELNQDWAKWTLLGSQKEQSGHYRNQIWAQIEQSGRYRGPNRAKWALSGVDVVQGWIWTHYHMVKVDDSMLLSTK